MNGSSDEALDAYVAALVADAPDLSEDQRDALGSVLGGAR